MAEKPSGTPRPAQKPLPYIKHDSGGAPGPKYTIPCPPKPKK